jgi:hypothetical protein
MNSNSKGNIALGQAIAYFTSQLYTISLPLNDCQWYDLIIEKDNIFQTVQVKYSGKKTKSGKYSCGLITTNPATGQKIYSVTETPVDLLFCYCEDENKFLIPVKEITNNSAITLYSEKPNVSNPDFFDTFKY